MKNITDWIGAICAIIAVGAAIASYFTARAANTKSDKAMKLSRQQFLEENRPHLVIKPITDEKTGFYIVIEETDILRFRVHLRYQLKNVGSVIASNVFTPDTANFTVNEKNEVVLKGDIRSSVISIPPGESIVSSIWVDVQSSSPEEAEKYIKELRNGEGKMTHDFPAIYQNEIDPSLRYLTQVHHEISKDKVSILGYEMKKIAK